MVFIPCVLQTSGALFYGNDNWAIFHTYHQEISNRVEEIKRLARDIESHAVKSPVASTTPLAISLSLRTPGAIKVIC